MKGITRTQLPIFTVKTEDGGVALQIGEDSPLIMGYDGYDLMRLLNEIFPDTSGDFDMLPVDYDLIELTDQWLDEDKARERRAMLNRAAGYREW